MLIEMVFVSLAAVAAAPAVEPQYRNSVFEELIEEGLAVTPDGGKKAALPRPSMPEGASAAEQRKIIAELPGNRPYDDMVRNAIVAPFAMRIEEVENPAGDPLRRVDVWFIAYGRLQQFFDERQAASLVQWAATDKKSSAGEVLSADDLRRHSIVPAAGNGVREQFIFRQGVLFDRVRVGATYRVMTTLERNAVVIAAVIDPRFNEDEKYPNYWQSIPESGEPAVRQRYATAAAYCKVSPLLEPNGALFVEQHFLFAEPRGWFRGAPLLRSKLPLAIQDSVRQLRRQLRSGGDASSVPGEGK